MTVLGIVLLCDTLTACNGASTQANLSTNDTYNLGMDYLSGHGVSQDTTKAAALLSQAADPNKYHQNGFLGDLLGQSVSSQAGNPDAQRMLATLLSSGNGIPQDTSGALLLYQEAALQGDGASQAVLGLAYKKGKGVAESLPTAYAWYELSVKQNNDIDGKLGLQRITPKMSDEEKALGEQLYSNLAQKVHS